MKITPIDIRQQQFGKTFRGLDPKEVDSFLNLVSDELESLQREHNRVKEDLARIRRIVEEHRERERALKETMITAQKITEDIKESARKEAEVILSRAEVQAEKIIQAANHRLLKVIEDINEMKRQREQLRINMSHSVEAHRQHLHEITEEKMETQFLKVEDLKQRRSALQAQIRELLEAQASLLGMDRDREFDDLREEVVRLQHLHSNLNSALQGILESHNKLIETREESENQRNGFHVEENIKVLKRPDSQNAQPEPQAKPNGLLERKESTKSH